MKNKPFNLLKGGFLTDEASGKSWAVIVFISVLAIVTIASSHSVDKKVYKIARLGNEVKEYRSLFVDGRSKLMRLKMESSIVNKMSVKGVVPSVNPPKKIKIKSKK